MIIAFTTVAKKPDAERLARLLVEKRLAACVNILKMEKSVYRWKGKILEAGEFLLLIKTTKERYCRLETTIKLNHPYSMPEVIKIKVDGGLKKYLNWVARPY